MCRSVLTITMTLAWVYGLAVLTYQYGILNWTKLPCVQEAGVRCDIIAPQQSYIRTFMSPYVASAHAYFTPLLCLCTHPTHTPRAQGLYWFAPVMSFSVVVGVGLDYDIFLLTR